ncbi:MAG: hypothetical protein H6812_09255 [Phycisphaeraceae bacterium]|nr:hypothetical protein [Phycisphaerales bacterium]MCB9843428.1 hypothetical protein [Phycisphaeraceae bacterium]
MNPMVLLRHETPDNEHHFDWMLSRAGDAGPLITFRCRTPIDVECPPGASLERLPDHRRHYLTFEGEISHNRGRVTRVATGRCNIIQETSDRLELDADWEGAPTLRITIEQTTPDAEWIIRSITQPPEDRR